MIGRIRLVLVAALGLVALVTNASADIQDSSGSHGGSDSVVGDGKIKVELYYESQCPGCRQVLTKSFKKAFDTPGFLNMADITLVPFGNAQEGPSDDKDTYKYECQHGPSECRYNAVEACALSKISCPYHAFEFINCIENSDENREPDQNYGSVVKACAALTNLADIADDIEECSTGPEGNGLIHHFAVKTGALDPPHTYVPWIVVGGEHNETTQNEIGESLLKYVCYHYEGPDKSAACKELDSSGFYSGIRSSVTRLEVCVKDDISLTQN